MFVNYFTYGSFFFFYILYIPKQNRRIKLKEASVHRLVDLISLEDQLRAEEMELSSELLGEYLGSTGDSIRKDLSQLKRSKGRGHYNQRNLKDEITKGLGLNLPVSACLVGLGHQGRQILDLIPRWETVKLQVLFDTRINRLERLETSIPSFPAWEIPEYLPGKGITTAILATEPEETEKNGDRLIKGGISYILNLSGYYLSPVEGVRIKNMNILTELLNLLARSGTGR